MRLSNLLFASFLVFFITSCNTEEDDSSISPSTEFFDYTYESGEIEITSWQAVRINDSFGIVGTADNGQSIGIILHESGTLAEISSFNNTDFDFPRAKSYVYYKSNYFDFELIELDEENNRISATFSGNLYDDKYDLSSDTFLVDGAFNLNYVEQPVDIYDETMYAQIDGEDWYETESFSSGSFYNGGITLNKFNDSPYLIGVKVSDESTVGTTFFDSNTSFNTVVFARFDTSIMDYIPYEVEGSFTLDEITEGFGKIGVSGSFNLTASSDEFNETVVITNGSFQNSFF